MYIATLHATVCKSLYYILWDAPWATLNVMYQQDMCSFYNYDEYFLGYKFTCFVHTTAVNKEESNCSLISWSPRSIYHANLSTRECRKDPHTNIKTMCSKKWNCQKRGILLQTFQRYLIAIHIHGQMGSGTIISHCLSNHLCEGVFFYLCLLIDGYISYGACQ